MIDRAVTSGGVGILGVGAYLPPEVRGNDWWPAEIVEGWIARRAAMRASASSPPASEGARKVLAALAAQGADPFQNAVERRVIAPGQDALDLEEGAARDAIAASGVDPATIDLVLTHTPMPEYLLSNLASALHHRLGLTRACLAFQVDASSYAFLAQLTVARAMIASGAARCALLVQSCVGSRLVDQRDPLSALIGDGATAVVVGAVPAGRGVVAAVHETDGRYPHTLIASVPGSSWYADGRALIHIAEPERLREVNQLVPDLCRDTVAALLARSGHRHDEVAFFCIHQGTPWLRQLVQDHAGLSAARANDTFTRTGYLYAASIPLGLRDAARDGHLRNGDLAVLFGGGTGMTYGATALIWSAA